MEEKSSQPKSNPILFILITAILVVVVLNLLLTSAVLVRIFSQPNTALADNSNPLPKELSSAKRSELFEQVKNLYNAKDAEGLYNLLAPDAQLQVSKQSIIETVNKLHSTFGKIGDGAYSDYEFAKASGGKKFIVLHYVIKFSDPSSFSAKGTCRINVAVSDAQVEIYGFFISSLNGGKN